MVGINATRLFSTLYGQTLNVGRVMTPTLAMAVMREAAIAAFKPEPFYTVQLQLDGFTAASGRFKSRAEAEALKKDCSLAKVTKAESKEKAEKPPALYDLTSLQREANRAHGYTAQQTLDYTQSLYEKKLVTYPRTDSRFLTEDMAGSLPELIDIVIHTFPIKDVDSIPIHAAQVVDNKKVTDHHAILPTKELQKYNLDELPSGELAILQLIADRLCVAVGDSHRYAETVIELESGGNRFTAKGKTVLHNGWKALVLKQCDKNTSGKDVQTLPSVVTGTELCILGREIKEGKTTPPNGAYYIGEPEIMGDVAAWQIGRDRILAVQTCEDGYDYTLFDGEYQEIDGGQIDNPDLSMIEARKDILESFGLENRELRAMVYDDVMEKAEKITGKIMASLHDIEPKRRDSVMEKLAQKSAQIPFVSANRSKTPER